MTTVLFLQCVVEGSAPYLKPKEFASLVTTSQEVRKQSTKNDFAKCVAYLVPEAKLSYDSASKFLSILINAHQKLIKHLESPPPKSHPAHTGHFGRTFLSKFTFEDAPAGTTAYIKNHRQKTVEWSDSMLLSSKLTVQEALFQDGTKCDLELQLVFQKRSKEMALAVVCQLDPNAIMDLAGNPGFGWFEVDVKVAPNSTLVLNMPDVLVKANGLGELKGMCHVKKADQLEQTLKTGIVCSIAVRSLTPATFEGRYADFLNLDDCR